VKIKLLLFLALVPFFLKAQDAGFDSRVETGIMQIYNIQFEAAEETFRRLIADYPDKPAGRFFLAMIDWWRILIDLDNEEYDDLFYEKLEDVIFQCDQILRKNSNDVDALFFKGGAIGFRGRLRAYRESWIKAADDGREALPIVERSSILDPNRVDVQLGFGIYNYYASVIPNEYPLLKPLMIFFPKGDKLKGLQQLEDAAMRGEYSKYEARYFLTTLYFQHENDPLKAEQYSKMLVEDFPDNPVFQKWAGRIEAKKGNFHLASIVFQDVLSKADDGMPGYDTPKTRREATYYIGVQYRNTNQLDSAKFYLEESAKYSRMVDTKEDSGFLINSILYLGMVNDQLGNRSEAVEYYNSLLKMREYGKSRTLAREYLQKPYGR
jgi:tetratricopeptide (TPR) repeat protein